MTPQQFEAYRILFGNSIRATTDQRKIRLAESILTDCLEYAGIC